MGLSSSDYVVTGRPQVLLCGHCVGQLLGLCSTGQGRRYHHRSHQNAPHTPQPPPMSTVHLNLTKTVV